MGERTELIDGATDLLDTFREEFRAELARLHGREALIEQLRSSWDPADYLDPSLPPLEERDQHPRAEPTAAETEKSSPGVSK